MAYTVHVAGAAEIKIGTGGSGALEGLGYTRNGVTIRFEDYSVEEKGDENGGDDGPPIEVLMLGECADVQLELNKWDATVMAKVQRLKGGTAGQPAAAGTLVIGGEKYYRLAIASANMPHNFPLAMLIGTPIELGPVGTKFAAQGAHLPLPSAAGDGSPVRHHRDVTPIELERRTRVFGWLYSALAQWRAATARQAGAISLLRRPAGPLGRPGRDLARALQSSADGLSRRRRGRRRRPGARGDQGPRRALRDLRRPGLGRAERPGAHRLGTRRAGPPVRGVCHAAKKNYQPWADAVATLGLGCLDFSGGPGRSYECFVGLWLNTQRIADRRGFAMLRAVEGALSAETPARYFAAMADTEEEGQTLHALHVSRTAFQRGQAPDTPET